MKRVFITLVTACALMCALITGLTACGLHEHDFTAEKALDKYKVSDADCLHRAVYYKSCAECGEKGTETFESGGYKHDFGGGVTCVKCSYHKPSDGLEYVRNLGITGVKSKGACTDTDIYIADTYDGQPVTDIFEYAFSGCSSITDVTIPNSVTSIDRYAFNGCDLMTSIAIPESVTWIGWNAFSGCTSLTEITIPSGVWNIREQTFSGCTSLTGVTLPDGLATIEARAFSGCSSLSDVNIPDDVTVLQYAFADCSALTSIKFPNGTTYIAEGTFSGCAALTDVTIPKSVRKIGSDAFAHCVSLSDVIIPDSVEYIGSEAFLDCDALTIYCEAKEQPSGWSSRWNASHCRVVWGYTDGEDSD